MTGRVYPTIGVDPGERWIGLAARIDGRCVDAATLDRGPTPTRGTDYYLGDSEPDLATRLLEALDTLMRRNLTAAEEAAAGWDVPATDLVWRVALEGLVLVNSKARKQPLHYRVAQLQSCVATGVALGVVVATYPGVVVVRPRRYGNPSDPKHGDVLAKLGPYPQELKGGRPHRFLRGDPSDDRRHERAAWAIAGAAQMARPLRLKPQVVLAG